MKHSKLLLISALVLGSFAPVITSCNGTEDKISLSIALKEGSTDLEIGDTREVEVTLIGGNKEDLTWNSSNSDVAKVDNNGKITALKEGTTKITATLKNITSNEITLTVKKKVVTVNISLKEGTTSLKLGETREFEANIANNDDNLPVVWHSSNEEVATIENGLVTTLAIGSVEIFATVGDVTSNKITLTIGAPDPTGVTVENSEITLGLGEKFEINATVTPLEAAQEYTLVSSDELVIGINGHTIEALALTEPNTPVDVTVKVNEIIQTVVKVSVIKLSEVALNKANELLAASKELEVSDVQKGTYDYKKFDSTNTLKEYTKSNFEVYNNNKSVTEIEEKTSYSHSFTRTTRGIDDATYFEIDETKETDKFVVDSTNLKPIVEADATWSQINRSDAILQTSLGSLDNRSFGATEFVLDEFINGYSFFGATEAQEKMHYTYSENTLNLHSDYWRSARIYEVDLTLKFTESLLTEFNFNAKVYEGDYDNEAYKGALIEEEVHSATLTKGTRGNGEGTLTLNDLYFTDYTPMLVIGYGSTTEVTEFKVGEKGRLALKSSQPESGTTDVDPIGIVEISDPTVAKISGYGDPKTEVEFLKAAESVTITTRSSKGIEKQITVRVVQPAVTSIAFQKTASTSGYLPSKVVAGFKKTVLITPSPKGSVADLNVTLENNTCGATVTMVEGKTDQFELVTTGAGSVDVVVEDKTLGATSQIRKTVTSFNNTDEGISEFLANAEFYETNYGLSGVKFTQDSQNKANGSVEFTFGSDNVIKANYAIKDGSLTYTVVDEGIYEASSLRFYDSTKKDPSRLQLKYDDDFYDTYVVDLFVK